MYTLYSYDLPSLKMSPFTLRASSYSILLTNVLVFLCCVELLRRWLR